MSTRPEPVADLVALVVERLRAADADGTAIARFYSDAVAARIVAIVGPLPAGYAVVAQGGLARRQLLPGTDVDLLFLHDDEIVGALHDQPVNGTGAGIDIGDIVARLWDAGFKASWSVRGARELTGLFDVVDGKLGHAAMAVLEARPIAGDLDFAAGVLTSLRRTIGAERRRRLLVARLLEAWRRRARFSFSPALVEPDVKDGPGGLRDAQLLGWVGLCVSGVDVGVDVRLSGGVDGAREAGDTLGALLRAGVLPPSAVTTIAAARSELLLVRAALLCASNGTEHRVHAAAAETAAGLLADDPATAHMRPGEALVRRATRAMRTCIVAVDDAIAALLPPSVARALPFTWPLRPKQPTTPLGLGALLSSTETIAFPGPLTGLLERGILPTLLSDIDRLQGRVKHDGIHAFCTDAHLARCGDLALAIVGGASTPTSLTPSVLGDLALPAPLLPVLARIERTAVVVAGALFHDIGKGLPGDHSLVGEEIARRELPRLGMNDDDVDDVCFIIRHHLLLSTTAQRSDLGDPRVIDQLTAVITTPERLDALAIVTWCDWCAVGPGIGTAWKARLLADCVDAVREALLQPEQRARDERSIRKRAHDAIDDTDGIDNGNRFVADASVGWLRSRTALALVDDARAFATLQAAGGGALVGLPGAGVPQRAWVLTPDRPGLLADLAAAFSSEGVNVLDARLDVRADGQAFDCFVFDDGRAGLVGVDGCRMLEAALQAAIAGRVRPATSRRSRQQV
ncbi:MAG TPA: HD domain-containing protein, partial [Myxococcota bacterium]